MSAAFVVFASSPARVARVRGPAVEVTTVERAVADTVPASWAAAVADALATAGWAGAPVALALPSDWCLCASVPFGDLPRRNRRQLMVYRFEEQLPIAADDLVVDFAMPPATEGHAALDRVLGVGVVADRALRLIDALEAVDVPIQTVSPIAVLAAQAYVSAAASAHGRHGQPDALAWTTDVAGEANGPGAIEFIEWRRRCVAGWTTEPKLDGLRLQVRRFNLLYGRMPTVAVCGPNSAAIEAVGRSLAADVNPPEGGLASYNGVDGVRTGPASPTTERLEHRSVVDAAAVGAAAVLAGERVPFVELRRGRLASNHPFRRVRVPALAATAAAAALALSMAAAMLVAAAARERRADRCVAAQRAIYREAVGVPLRPEQSEVVARLAREDRRLAGLNGVPAWRDGAGSAGSPAAFHRPRSALMMLEDVLRALPTDVRLRVLDIRLSPAGLEVAGQARSHGDADAVADGLRGLGGYAVDPPHSDAQPDGRGVSFFVSARPLLNPPVKVQGSASSGRGVTR